MYSNNISELFKKYKFILLAILLIAFIIIFIIIKSEDNIAKENSLDEETAEPQISADIKCETMSFLETFSASKSELVCFKVKDFISKYNSYLSDDEEYISFIYVENSFTNNSFKIKSSTGDEYKITIHDIESGLFLSSSPQLHSRS